MKILILSLLVAIGGISCRTARQKGGEVVSPNGLIKVNVELNDRGEPVYHVAYGDEWLIRNARLGIIVDSVDYSQGMKEIAKAESAHSDTWEPVWGQFAQIENSYHEMVWTLRKGNAPALSVVFRVFDDGLGFRYEIAGSGQAVIADEVTQFNMVSDNMAYWVAPCWENDEYIYQVCRLSEVSKEKRDRSALNAHAQYFPCETGFNTPVTMKTPHGTYLSIHEAAIWNYPGSSLCLNPSTFEIRLSPAGEVGKKAVVELPFRTPWRTVTIGQRAGDLVESSLILNLNEPCALTDVSFIKPMKYVGIWWEMHLKKSTWELENSYNHGANTANVKRYIDFAAGNGLQGVLVEGWNKGWNGWNGFDYTSPYPDFDLQELSAYAKSKGVELIGHHETGGNVQNYISQLDTAYQYYQSNGVHAVKTGYVGKVPGHFHYDQWMVDHYNQTVTLGAQHHISLCIHEPIKPSGICRTYPNLMSGEGMRGQEFNAWSDGNNLTHHTILPFTRNLAGPMDYTPGIFDLQLLNSVNRGYTKLTTDAERRAYPFKHRVKTTLAHQLALYVVFYSPLQMAADLPENYQGHAAFQFIRDVPVDWADTKVLDAEIAQYVVTARRDKHSDNWFVGGITNGEPRAYTVDLSFLDEGAAYKAVVYTDAPDADWDLNPAKYDISARTVRKGDKLEVKMAAGGGFAISIMKD
ncbi:MAG: glycoside hydrolase family 97 protein [Breznakibacter sp.]